MKTLVIKLGSKTYTSGKITAYHSKEAFAINKDLLAFAKHGQSTDTQDVDAMESLLQEMNDISTRKANLICEVYGNKFTADELERNLSSGEIDDQINKIVDGIMGIVEKN